MATSWFLVRVSFIYGWMFKLFVITTLLFVAFNISNPQNTVSQVAESAMRQIAGTSTLDHIVNENRTDVNFKAQSELQTMLNEYVAGIEIRQVNITEVHPPRNVKEAFDDVVKAREDQKTYITQANEYAKRVIPEAEGKVLKIIQEAEAYKESVIAEAKGKADANKILSASLTDKILQDKGIEATLKLSESPNSKVVIVGSSKDGLPLILGNN